MRIEMDRDSQQSDFTADYYAHKAAEKAGVPLFEVTPAMRQEAKMRHYQFDYGATCTSIPDIALDRSGGHDKF